MRKEERFERIRSELARKGSVHGDELASLLIASRATIRRDLASMQRLGMLRRTHGGAAILDARDELPFQTKVAAYLPEKRAIGFMAATLIREGWVIGSTGGTTVIQAIKALKDKKVTIVTNAINLAMEMAASEFQEVIVTGGILRSRSYELVGHIAEQTIQAFHLDLALIGVDGLDLIHGLSSFTIGEAHAAALYIKHAREVWVVVDHSKIGTTAPALIAPLSAVGRIITDSGLPQAAAESLSGAGVAVTIAPL